MEGINKNFQRIILFSLYLILVLLGWLMGLFYPDNWSNVITYYVSFSFW